MASTSATASATGAASACATTSGAGAGTKAGGDAGVAEGGAATSACARLRTTKPGPAGFGAAGLGLRSPTIFSNAVTAWSSSRDEE